MKTNEHIPMKALAYSMMLLVLSLFSCSDSDPEQLPDDPIIHTRSGLIGENFYFSTNSTTLNNLSLESDDPEIAIGEFLTGINWIWIKTKKEGKTIVRLKDHDKILATIYVSVRYFGGDDIEEIAMHPYLKTEVFVNAQDPAIKTFIEDELWKEAKQRKRTQYAFNERDKTFRMYIPQLEETYYGSYEWNIDSLVLRYNDVEEKYAFKIETGSCYVIQADKTESYKLLYPDAGVTDARLKRIWYDYWMGGFHVGGI